MDANKRTHCYTTAPTAAFVTSSDKYSRTTYPGSAYGCAYCHTKASFSAYEHTSSTTYSGTSATANSYTTAAYISPSRSTYTAST